MPGLSLFGSLPSGWESMTLGEACSRLGGNIQTGPFGSQLHAADYVQYGIPSIMPENLNENRISTDGIARISHDDANRLNRYLVREGDIVYSRRGDVTKRAQVTREENGWLCGTGCLRVRFGGSGINPKYAFYYLGHPSVKEWIKRHAIGATLPNLNTSILSALPFLLPPTEQQHSIATTLGVLDEKIELNRRMSETLEAMARAIFKSWFVDFDPVRAKFEGRQPFGMDAKTAALFPNSFEDSLLGKIPAGWAASTVGEHMLNFDSKRVPVSSRERLKRRGQFPYHGAAGVMDYVDDYLFDGIYLLIGEDGSVVNDARLAVTQYVWGKLWVNNHAHVLQGRDPVSTEQLYLYFQFEPVAPYVTGAVQPKLSQGRMNMMPFISAVPAVCNEFTNVTRPLFAKVRQGAEENRTLTALRDMLLPKLISGEIRIKDAEKIVGERV